jgi:hypothetical protein
MDINVKKNKYWFYRCYHCGQYHYSKKRIKRKKCLTCKRTFKFEHSVKFSKTCTRNEAIAIMKYLKKQDAKEEFGFFIPKLKTNNVK